MREEKVLHYLSNFMDQYQLFPKSGRGVIAVSGGVDSLLLAYLLSRPLLREKYSALVGIHINHGTRIGCQQEEDSVVAQLGAWGLLCHVERRQMSLGLSNFEHQARKMRYQIFSQYVESPADRIYLGHQIDDSFEWYCMQQWKSAGGHALGIPVRRGNIARPLMCFTKEQIEHLAHRWEIAYHFDLSNQDERFERNFLRHQIIPHIRKAYPHYLRHYVFRARELAKCLGHQQQMPPKFLQRRLVGGGIFLIHPQLVNNFQGAESLITSLIWELSGKQRGQLAREIEKLIRAQQRGQHGPHHFSGGVRVAMGTGYLFFFRHHRGHHPEELVVTDVEIAQIPDVEIFFQKPSLFLKTVHNIPLLKKYLVRYHPLLPEGEGCFFYDLFKIYRAKVISNSCDKRLN